MEREGKHVLENPKGFATYKFMDDGCYIEDIYVLPEERHSGVAGQMADYIAEITKSKGLKHLYGSVCPQAENANASLKVLMAYGFELHSAGPNMVYMKKVLK